MGAGVWSAGLVPVYTLDAGSVPLFEHQQACSSHHAQLLLCPRNEHLTKVILVPSSARKVRIVPTIALLRRPARG